MEYFRQGVQPKQVAVIAEITVGDCKAVEIAMTECSQCLPGHDQALVARVDTPVPETINAEIQALLDWVAKVRRRHR